MGRAIDRASQESDRQYWRIWVSWKLVRLPSPNARDRIGIERRVGAEEKHVLDDGLRDEQPVEGVAVVQ